MKFATNMEPLRTELERQGITLYKLAQACQMKSTTMYSYMAGESHMGEKTCRAVADILRCPVAELFPDLVEKVGTEQPKEVHSGVDASGKKCRITVDDMMVGCQTMLPDDGVTLVVKGVVNNEGREYSGYTLGDNQCCTIKTGVSTKNLDLNRLTVRTKQKMAMDNHIFALPTPYSMDHELCLVMHSHGGKTVLNKGVAVAELIFL